VTKAISYLFLLFFCYSCADSQNVDQKSVIELMVEKSENIIVERLTRRAFTGHINLTNKEGITFKGFVKKGEREGECSWIKADGDTIEYQQFVDNEVMYSVQFTQGKRDNLWIQNNLKLEKKDTILINDVTSLLLESNYSEIAKRIVNKDLPYAELIRGKMLVFNLNLGTLRKIQVLETTKKVYNFRPEKYIELKTKFKFDSKEVSMGIRILEIENNLHSVEIWEIKSKGQKEYLDFNIWSFMD
jgi:hypothetical protein